MKSVGEAMAIGRNFKESLQKALVSLETGFSGLDRIFKLNKKQIEKKLKENIPNKILLVGEAFRKKGRDLGLGIGLGEEETEEIKGRRHSVFQPRPVNLFLS